MGARRKRRTGINDRGGSNRMPGKSHLAFLSNELASMKWDKILGEERRVVADRARIAADRLAAQGRQNLDDVLTAIQYGTSATSKVIDWVNMDKQGVANKMLTERFLGMTPEGYAQNMDVWEASDVYSDTKWYEGHWPDWLPGKDQKPKYAIPGKDRVQHTDAYKKWIAEGSQDYSDVTTNIVGRTPNQGTVLSQWQADDPTFRTSTAGGYTPGQDIVHGAQQPGGGPGNMIGAKVGHNEAMADYLMDGNTFIGGDIGQELGIGKNSRGQIIDLDSGAVMDRELLNARISQRKMEIDLNAGGVESPAIVDHQHLPKPGKYYDKRSGKYVDIGSDAHADALDSDLRRGKYAYTNQKVEGWKGRLGIYDTATGFQATGQEGGLEWGGMKGQGWVEQADGTIAYEAGVMDTVGGVMAAYNMYDNIANTEWGGEDTYDDVGAGLQIVGSALYFVPVPGARVVGTVLNVIGAGIEKYGGKDEDWWFGENSVWGSIF